MKKLWMVEEFGRIGCEEVLRSYVIAEDEVEAEKINGKRNMQYPYVRACEIEVLGDYNITLEPKNKEEDTMPEYRLLEYQYKLTTDEDVNVIVETDCPPHHFQLAVEFVKKIEGYNVDMLYRVIEGLSYQINEYVPPNLLHTYIF